MRNHLAAALTILAAVAAGVAAIGPAGSDRTAVAAATKREEAAIAALESRIEDLEAAMARLTGAVIVDASGNVTIKTAKLKLAATHVEVASSFARFSGAIEATSLKVDSVAARSYTPGAGNLQ